MTLRRTLILLASTIVILPHTARAGVIEFFDRSEWEAVVGDYTTLDFTGFAVGTVITTQYSDLGITFTDGFYTIFPENPVTFPNDGWGLDGNGDITVEFDEPQSWIAAAFPGILWYELYRDDALVYTSSIHAPGEAGAFYGLSFPEQFDKAILMEPGQVALDDLLFGAPVPSPPAVGLLALGLIGASGRSRREA